MENDRPVDNGTLWSVYNPGVSNTVTAKEKRLKTMKNDEKLWKTKKTMKKWVI